MTIKLYQNLSDTNEVNKNIILITTLTGTFRKSTSLTNPIIEIESAFDLKIVYDIVDEDDYEILNVGVDDDITFADVNYIYIEEFKRYYFVNDIQIMSTSLYALICEIDVLMSFKEQFLPLDAFVTRNEFDYDERIPDDLVSFKYNKEITYVKPINLSAVKELKSATLNPNTIITYLSDDTIYPSSSTPSVDGLPVISNYVSGGNLNTQYFVCVNGVARDIIKNIYKEDNVTTFVKSITAYPFDIDYYYNDAITQIKIGSKSVLLTDTFRYPQHYPDRIVIAHFRQLRKYNDYRDYSPYTKYELYIPYCQMIELSGESFLGNEIKVFYVVNYEDATATAYVYNVTQNKVLFCGNALLGVKLGLSSTNATEIKNQKTALALNTAVGVLGSSVAFASGVASGNAFATAQGVISGTSTIGNAITTANQMYDRAKIENSSAVDGLSNTQFVYLRITEMERINDSAVKDYYGKPLNQKRNLSTLTGYTKVSDIHLDNIDATKTEIEKLYVLLNNGIRI